MASAAMRSSPPRPRGNEAEEQASAASIIEPQLEALASQ
jgi:hypothetical protein